MRVFAAAIMGLCLAFVTQPAWSQTTSSNAQEMSFSASHIAAARDTLSAMLIESGAISAGSLQAYTVLAPQFRTQITSSPLYAQLTPQRQQAITAYIDGIGPIGQEEAVRGAPDLITRFAPRMALLFSEAELGDISTYMRSPEGSALFRRSVIDGVNAEANRTAPSTAPSPAETEALERFSQTAGGIAFQARTAELGVLMTEVGQAATGAPHIAARLRRDMCAIVGEQCPPGWRQ